MKNSNFRTGQQGSESELIQIAVPITAEQIIEQLKSSEYNSGEYSFFIYSQTIVVAAGLTTVYEVFPANTINVLYKHHTLTSDFYDSTITIAYRIDNTRYDLTPLPIPFNEAKELTLSYYLPVKIKQAYEITNPFAFDINVTVYFEAVEMNRSFYDSWYKVLLNASETKLNELVALEGGNSR